MRKTADLVCLVLLIATFSWLPRPQSTTPKPAPASPPPARATRPDKPVVVADLPGPKPRPKKVCHHVWRTMWGGPSQPWTCDVADLGDYCERCGEGLDRCRARQADYYARIAQDPAWQRIQPRRPAVRNHPS